MTTIIFRAAMKQGWDSNPVLCAHQPVFVHYLPGQAFSPASPCAKLGWPQVWNLHGAEIGQQKSLAEELSKEREVTGTPPPPPPPPLGLVSLSGLPPEFTAPGLV